MEPRICVLLATGDSEDMNVNGPALLCITQGKWNFMKCPDGTHKNRLRGTVRRKLQAFISLQV